MKSCLRPAEYEWAYYCCTDVGERVLFRKKLCSNHSPHEAVEYEVA